jgi:hypothetical protein
LAAGVHAVGDHQGAVLHPAAGADLLHLGVQPQVRIGTLQRPLSERGDLLIQPTAQPRDGIFGHPGQPQRLHQPVDLAGRHAVDIGLLDHRHQPLLAASTWLQEAREVGPGPQPWDGQLDRPNPGVPSPLPVAVAAGSSLRVALTVAGTGGSRHLGLHQLLG